MLSASPGNVIIDFSSEPFDALIAAACGPLEGANA